MSQPLDPLLLARKTRKTALVCCGVVMGMTALAFAAVPLYDLFCKATGFAGTPMVREANTSTTSDRVIQVRFDANVAPGLGWRFAADEAVMSARVGQTMTMFYRVTNRGPVASTGIASFNVEPAQAAAHFVKIQCFCFTEQTLQPGESLDAPVVFYIDPEIEKNRELVNLRSMTLSYTFFPAKGGQPVAATKADEDKPKL